MTPTASPPPWSMFDIFLVLLLFFFLPGWVKSAMMLLPEEWRNERIEIRKEDLPKNISFGNNGKPGTAPPQRLGETPSFFRQTFERLESSEITEKLREAVYRLKPADEEQDVTSSEKVRFRGEHPLTVLILVSKRVPRLGWILGLTFVSAVVTAPFAEELVFRVVLMRGLLRYLPWATGVIFLQAVLFALIHIRANDGITGLDELNNLLYGVAAIAVSHILLVFFTLLWLRKVRGASWTDFGFTRKGFVSGIFKGLGFFCILWPVMLSVQRLLLRHFPETVPDPVPIFILALGLGIVFLRTKQFAANLAMHMALNFTSFCGILLIIRQ